MNTDLVFAIGGRGEVEQGVAANEVADAFFFQLQGRVGEGVDPLGVTVDEKALAFLGGKGKPVCLVLVGGAIGERFDRERGGLFGVTILRNELPSGFYDRQGAGGGEAEVADGADFDSAGRKIGRNGDAEFRVSDRFGLDVFVGEMERSEFKEIRSAQRDLRRRSRCDDRRIDGL